MILLFASVGGSTLALMVGEDGMWDEVVACCNVPRVYGADYKGVSGTCTAISPPFDTPMRNNTLYLR